MIRRPPRSTRTDTLFPYTTLFRSLGFVAFDLDPRLGRRVAPGHRGQQARVVVVRIVVAALVIEREEAGEFHHLPGRAQHRLAGAVGKVDAGAFEPRRGHLARQRSEEPTSELQSLMRISYAVFCLKKKTII